jgi:outer membrane protein TolC
MQMNKILIKIINGLFLLAFSLMANAQANSISLDSCYALVKQNYPLVKQYELIAKSKEYSVENLSKGYLPQININGQATYQSDVIQFPKNLPGAPVLSKDQYKIYAEVNQPVYDGGVIKEQKKLQVASSAEEEQKLNVELYQLKGRINQLFFGILLIDEQLKQNALMKNDIQLGLNKTNALIANGTALKSNADVLKAELLKAGQQTIELKSNRKAFTDMLSLFINRPLDETSVFIKPSNIIFSQEIKRPELLMYDYQNKIFDTQNNLLTAKNRPKLSFFVQGGFGKPAFNLFKDSFDPFYIGGLRLSIPLTGFYTIKNERSLININRKNMDVQKETFLFNTRFALKQQNAEITKLEEILKSDDEIIPLRKNIKNTALAQLENGVINSNDYLREVNAEDNARQNKILHEMQLLMAQYAAQTTSGN